MEFNSRIQVFTFNNFLIFEEDLGIVDYYKHWLASIE